MRRKNGEGSYRTLDNGMIQLKKQVGTRSNGTPRILTVSGTSETDCFKKNEKERR